DLGELREDLLLDVDVLGRGLDHEVDVGERVDRRPPLDPVEEAGSGVLGELALLHARPAPLLDPPAPPLHLPVAALEPHPLPSPRWRSASGSVAMKLTDRTRSRTPPTVSSCRCSNERRSSGVNRSVSSKAARHRCSRWAGTSLRCGSMIRVSSATQEVRSSRT